LSGESGNIGVGFAIPIEQVQVTTDQILRTAARSTPLSAPASRAARPAAVPGWRASRGARRRSGPASRPAT
jgi:hypothetical protein